MTPFLNTVIKALDDLRLKNIRVYDFRDVSPYYDYQIVASATNERQVHAAIDKINQILPQGFPLKVEGKIDNRWLLFDLGDMLVHVMHQETRDYYQIEKLFVERDQISLSGLTDEL